MAFPAEVRGPVENWELARLASIWAWEVVGWEAEARVERRWGVRFGARGKRERLRVREVGARARRRRKCWLGGQRLCERPFSLCAQRRGVGNVGSYSLLLRKWKWLAALV